jgi:hypothetical protein
LWVNGFESRTYGINDLVPPGRIFDVMNSLYFIKPDEFHVHIAKGYGLTQVRGRFLYEGTQYDLRITDPVMEQKYIDFEKGFYSIENTLLTISLAGKVYNPPDAPLSAGYYKLIAGVIELPKGNN